MSSQECLDAVGPTETDGHICVPSSLRHLQPWLSQGIEQDWIGVDPNKCLVFLPSFMKDIEALPVVPRQHPAVEELPYHRKCVPPVEPLTKPQEVPSCPHSEESPCPSTNAPDVDDGKFLHEQEKEIEDVKSPTDLCGLQEFYEAHDRIIGDIKKRHTHSLLELSAMKKNWKSNLKDPENPTEKIDLAEISELNQKNKTENLETHFSDSSMAQSSEEKPCFITQGSTSDKKQSNSNGTNQNAYSAFAREKQEPKVSESKKGISRRNLVKHTIKKNIPTREIIQSNNSSQAAESEEVDPDKLFFDKQLEEAYLATDPEL